MTKVGKPKAGVNVFECHGVARERSRSRNGWSGVPTRKSEATPPTLGSFVASLDLRCGQDISLAWVRVHCGQRADLVKRN